jgi:hypothetical protein
MRGLSNVQRSCVGYTGIFCHGRLLHDEDESSSIRHLSQHVAPNHPYSKRVLCGIVEKLKDFEDNELHRIRALRASYPMTRSSPWTPLSLVLNGWACILIVVKLAINTLSRSLTARS